MFGFLKRKGKPDVPTSTPTSAVAIPWKDNATLPIPDWDAKDWPACASFVCAADAGDGASRQHLGFPLATFAEVVLGPGEWAPDSARWQQGLERGQFQIGARAERADRASIQ